MDDPRNIEGQPIGVPAAPPPVPPFAPPTVPGALAVPVRRSSWPSIVGTLSIVLGCLGLLSAISQIVSPFFVDWIKAVMPESQRASMAGLGAYRWPQVAIGALGIFIAILLIVAGARTLKRRRSAAPLLWMWSIAKCLLAIAGSVVAALMQLDQARAMGAQATPGQAFVLPMLVFTVVFSLAWLTAYPLFLIVWLLRPKIRAEIRGWPA